MLVGAWSAIALEEASQPLVLVKGSQFIAIVESSLSMVVGDSGGVFILVLASNVFSRFF